MMPHRISSCLSLLVLACTPLLAETGAWQVDVNARIRWESRDQTYTFNRAVPSVTDDSWWLTRLRLGLKGDFAPGWSTYLQLQDTRELGSERSSVPFISGSEGDDPLDVRQAFVEYKTKGVDWRIGRQVIILGDERLVGPSDWNNFSRTFDAVRVTLPKIGDGLDVFISSAVQIQPGSTTGWHANHSNSRDLVGGVYSRFSPTPVLKLEPYLLGRHSTQDVVYSAGAAGSSRPYDVPQKILTVGVRLMGGPAEKLGGFDYDAEVAAQTGQERGRQLVAGAFAYPGPAWLQHRAWAAHAGIGYSFSVGSAPMRVYAEMNRATGDRDPTDQRSQSFSNLVASNHRPYGLMDVFAWKNMREVALTATSTILGTKVRVEQHWFDLDNVNDTWFRSNATSAVRPLNAAARRASRRAGAETDFVLARNLGKNVALELGFDYFAAGAYLRQTGGASDARLGYVQTVFQW